MARTGTGKSAPKRTGRGHKGRVRHKSKPKPDRRQAPDQDQAGKPIEAHLFGDPNDLTKRFVRVQSTINIAIGYLTLIFLGAFVYIACNDHAVSWRLGGGLLIVFAFMWYRNQYIAVKWGEHLVRLVGAKEAEKAAESAADNIPDYG